MSTKPNYIKNKENIIVSSTIQEMALRYPDIVPIAVEYAKTRLKGEFLVGRDWKFVPITHDIFRSCVWIYNTEIFTIEKIEPGVTIVFMKLKWIPDLEIAKSLEWRTIDCMSFSRTYSGVPYSMAENDLHAAIFKGKLEINTLLEYARKYGDEVVIKSVEEEKFTYDFFKATPDERVKMFISKYGHIMDAFELEAIEKKNAKSESIL